MNCSAVFTMWKAVLLSLGKNLKLKRQYIIFANSGIDYSFTPHSFIAKYGS